MIRAQFLKEVDGALLGFHISGHAGGEEGTDIVCAAASSAAYLVANTVTEVAGANPAELYAEDGDMLLRLEPEDGERCRELLLGLRLHLEGLSQQYPDEVRVEDVDITRDK